MSKWVYFFGDGQADGRADMKNLLGGKGANLAEMSSLGVPVPAGFTITTEVCTFYYDNNETYPDDLKNQVMENLGRIETIMGAKFGDPKNPLLLSIRSGARTSMPGMMDTVLNLGLNDTTVEGLIALSGDARFAYDSYRRFVTMYSDVVLGVDHYHFEEILDALKEDKGYRLDTDVTADDWKHLVGVYKAKVLEQLGSAFPEDPVDQLWGAVGAVFGSWMNQRAKTYRRLHHIPAHWGTAVNVQAMVFGNMGEESATGVCFTRDPSTGENAFYGEYLVNAQGEDVVAGIRTPQNISIAGKERNNSDLPAMEETMPEIYKQLVTIRDNMELHYKDMQDMEFTIQRGKLWMLQTRNGKRTAAAALKIAVDMCNEGMIDKETAILRVQPEQLDQLLHPTLDPNAPRELLGHGLPASPGAASGQVVFTADEAEAWAQKGKKVVLVRVETSPEDIGGMHVSQGILTTRGGMTSHAAVVARGMGVPCVAGAGEIRVDYNKKTLTVGGKVVKEGDIITLDGAKGEVFLGEVPTLQPELSGDFADLMEWADAVRRMRVRANAETAEDCSTARKFGAEGVGLCRTEHMFFDPKRIIHIRQMILAEDEAGRRAALEHLLPYQRQDFVEVFQIMRGLPVTVRLLDPPLHEFLPHSDTEIADVAASAGVDAAMVKSRVAMLQESNPMLGHRGCRLGITYPEVYEMQARAIFEAALEVSETAGETVLPEIMIPLVGAVKELEPMRALVDRVAKETFAAKGREIAYQVGTMIELPRACLQAGGIAEHAEFFSFGTNDLTQTTLGMSRDDSAPFLEVYTQKGIYARDPFQSIDVDGVGEMVKIAAERGRTSRPDIKLGICGEHGGDPNSIHFCEGVGLAYVSCSPYRVPIARLAAAQSVLLKGKGAEVDR
ncbi:pyruvate, phosphate dikinase [Roseospira navarrensis]|uniref:Pyruvate, phosphate dikinase n=1 Tax=Roseospira navarrensis TaxID=140058 RepID=A0A7X1ZDB0_9PROT|nr:pyruvate, phosphate dikinase [Roseospira navarrensis]MQX36440.1 pyruvate, phosphate dikinase [Roseospira navarrensis]